MWHGTNSQLSAAEGMASSRVVVVLCLPVMALPGQMGPAEGCVKMVNGGMVAALCQVHAGPP